MTCPINVYVTPHAHQRMAERGVSQRQLDAVLRRGRRRKQADSVKVQVTSSQLGPEAPRRLINLLGIVVVLTPSEGVVKTVIRKKGPSYPPEVLRYLEASGPTFKLRELIEHKRNADATGHDDGSEF